MLRATVSFHWVSELSTCDWEMNSAKFYQVLSKELLPITSTVCEDKRTEILQQGNAPILKSLETRSQLQNRPISDLARPSEPFYTNTIENAWLFSKKMCTRKADKL